MLAASLAPSPTEPKGWGAIAGTLWAVLLFVGPQLVMVPVVPLLAALSISSNAKVFALHALVQLVTVIALLAVVNGYGLKPAAIGIGRIKAKHIAWALGALPVYFVLATVVMSLASALLPAELINQKQELGFTPGGTPLELSLIFVALVLVTPFAEEALFRGFLLRGFRRFGPVLASAVVSLLFAAAHFQINIGIDVFVLSLVLCYIRLKTDSLWPAVLVHSLKNFIAFYVLFILGVGV